MKLHMLDASIYGDMRFDCHGQLSQNLRPWNGAAGILTPGSIGVSRLYCASTAGTTSCITSSFSFDLAHHGKPEILRIRDLFADLDASTGLSAIYLGSSIMDGWIDSCI